MTSVHGVGGVQGAAAAEWWQTVRAAWALDGAGLAQAAGPAGSTRAAAEASASPGAAAPETPLDTQPAVLPLAPALLSALHAPAADAQRWRLTDGDARQWQALFDAAGEAGDHDGGDDRGDDHDGASGPAADPQRGPDADAPDETWPPTPDGASPGAALGADLPAWAAAALAHLLTAARATGATPQVDASCAAALRPVLQAWRAGRPVLLASPAGLASLCPSADATWWQARRWRARWRQARPAATPRWWAVRVGLSAQGLPRTLRELAPALVQPAGRVSCELRFDHAGAGLACWTEVLVRCAASPSLRALLGRRPSLPWLLCNRPLWALETE